MQLTEKQIDFLSKEIELMYIQIDKQRSSTTEFLKIYLSIILALFAYIYFIESKLTLNGIRVEVPNSNFIVFGGFGMLLCLIAFIIGWALLDNVTKSVYKSIKHYKHISNLRFLIGQTFEDNSFAKNSLLPLKQDNIPMRISAQVPIIGGLVNFALLLLNYYFLRLFFPHDISRLFTTLIITGLSIFYSNQLEKHFEEILIAQKLRPQKSESDLKNSVRQFVKQKMKTPKYRIYKVIYLSTLLVVAFLVVGAFFAIYMPSMISNNIASRIMAMTCLPFIFYLISTIPRYFMGRHRIEDISCFEFKK